MAITIKKGFCKNFKHDPSKGKWDHYYEILSVSYGKKKNADGKKEDEINVVYRPLYKSRVYELGKFDDHKNIREWIEPLPSQAFRDPKAERYEMVTDEEEIKALEKVRDEMYAELPTEFTVEIE